MTIVTSANCTREHIQSLPCCADLKGDPTLHVAQHNKKIGQGQCGIGYNHGLREVREPGPHDIMGKYEHGSTMRKPEYETESPTRGATLSPLSPATSPACSIPWHIVDTQEIIVFELIGTNERPWGKISDINGDNLKTLVLYSSIRKHNVAVVRV